jgi:hypothetical protein
MAKARSVVSMAISAMKSGVAYDTPPSFLHRLSTEPCRSDEG